MIKADYLESPEGRAELLGQLEYSEQNLRLEGLDIIHNATYQKLKYMWKENLISSKEFADRLDACILKAFN